MSRENEAPETAYNPATLEQIATSREPGAQPPPPPPETDPAQHYEERHMGIERPQTNDAERRGDALDSESFPVRAETLGVRPSALRDA